MTLPLNGSWTVLIVSNYPFKHIHTEAEAAMQGATRSLTNINTRWTTPLGRHLDMCLAQGYMLTAGTGNQTTHSDWCTPTVPHKYSCPIYSFKFNARVSPQ